MGRSIKEQLAAAKLPEHVLTVCLRGDLVATIEAKEDELRKAREDEQKQGARVGGRAGGKRSVQIAGDIEKLRAEMYESEVTFRLRALPKAKWRELKQQFPPSEDATEDRQIGVDLYGITPEVLPLVTVEPEMDADDWRKLEQVVSSGDWRRLGVAAVYLHEMGVDVPKSALASLILEKKDAESR